MMETFWQDLRYGIRMLLKNPGFTAVAMLTLALGIGANTAIFSLLKAVILRPLPGVRAADELVVVVGTFRDGQRTTLSYPDYKDLRDRNEVFAGLAASSAVPISLSDKDGVERIWGEIVSGNFFQVLGVTAMLGRTLLPEDDQVPGAHPVAVISHGLWQRRFGADPNVVGTTIALGGHQFTIVGVAAPGFRGSVVGLSLDVFVPLMMQPQVFPVGNSLDNRSAQWLLVQGRLKPGVTLAQADAAMKVLADQLAQEYPNDNLGRSALLLPLWKSPFGAQTFLFPVLSTLMVVVGLVLLIACANVANLMLARAAARQREMAIRTALGASRRRLVRQLLTESVLLSLLGGTAALLVATWTKDFLTRQGPPTPLPIMLDASFDSLVFSFTLLLALLSGIVFGLAPALQASRLNVVPALKDDPSSRQYRRSRLRNTLLVSQVAVSLLLLISAGLVVRSLLNAGKVDPGFEARHVFLLSTDLAPNGYNENSGRAFYQQLVERVQALSGVESVSLAYLLPLRAVGAPSVGIAIEGYQPRSDEVLSFHFNVVSPHYFATMGIPLVQGRDFTRQDNEKAPLVVIVNESFVHRFWPRENPLGKRIQARGRWAEVVGVVRDIKYVNLTEAPQPYLYAPFLQHYQADMTLHVRTTADPLSLRQAAERQVRALDPNLPVFDVKTLTEHMEFSRSLYAAAAWVLSAAGLLALLLASVGLYGVMAYTVTQRTHEIGVRVALGAQPGDVLWLFVRQGLVLTFTGVGIGLVAALGLTRFLSSVLLGVRPTDPLTFVGVAVLLMAVALLAFYLPARRATRVDPMVALRYE